MNLLLCTNKQTCDSSKLNLGTVTAANPWKLDLKIGYILVLHF